MDLSIIVPVYNVQDYISDCIQSILNIRNIDIEIIIVNDGSTDKSIDMIHSYINNENVKLVNKSNGGLSSARNAGLKQAIGNYISFIDSDDKIDPDAIVKLYELGIKSDMPDIIVGDYIYWNDKNNIRANGLTYPMQMSGDKLLTKFYNKGINSVVCCKLYKRNFLTDHSLYFMEGIYYEDVEWMPRTFHKAKNVVYFPISFYYYRTRPESITLSEFSKKKYYDCVLISSRYIDLATNLDRNVRNVFFKNAYYTFLKAILNYSESTTELKQMYSIALLKKMKSCGKMYMFFTSLCFIYTPVISCRILKIMLHTKRILIGTARKL